MRQIVVEEDARHGSWEFEMIVDGVHVLLLEVEQGVAVEDLLCAFRHQGHDLIGVPAYAEYGDEVPTPEDVEWMFSFVLRHAAAMQLGL